MDDAWNIFGNIEMGNGLEAWRQLNLDCTQLTQAEIFRLEDAVLASVRVSDPSQVPRSWSAGMPPTSGT